MTTFTIDPAHTDVLFGVKHMMVTTVRGTFRDVSGTLEIDEDDLTRSSGEIRFAAASIDTGVGARDDHLRTADFLDVEAHPEIVVRATGIRRTGEDRYVLTADVTLKGTTRPVELEVESLGFYTAMDGARRVGFSARTKIDRKQWGLNWNVALETGGWLVGDEIKFEIEVAAQEASEAAQAA